jgi:DNA-directed RNA polymerase specialized sigma24 family protein
MALSGLDENEGRWAEGLSTRRRSSPGRLRSRRPPGARTTRNEAELGLDRKPDARFVGAGATEPAGLIAGLRRARSWRVPPNWSALDWHEELRAVALAAAWQAEQDHDPARGVPLDGFVYCRVKAQALARYRQEWRYALRVAPVDTEIIETLAGADLAAHPARAEFESLDRALERLPERERWLLDQLFWQHRTETFVAAQLQISQQAINKRKQSAFRHLRTLLRGTETYFA